jgi:trehalose synthase
MRTIENIRVGTLIKDYTTYAALIPSVVNFQNESDALKKEIADRKIWMINSTEQGGGVAEMLPRLISLLRQIGIQAEWLVLETDKADFFAFTKKLHNLIHGAGQASISSKEKEVFDEVNRQNAERLIHLIRPNDIVVVHDPQPAGLISMIADKVDITTIWRCHIGLDHKNEQTQAAWHFLKPYLQYYDQYVFSAPEYIPDYLSGNVSIIYPSIDPLTHKNRELSIHKLSGILANAGLAQSSHPRIANDFNNPAKIYTKEGVFKDAQQAPDIGLLFRPIISQVSRWDRLKGFRPLMEGFVHMKQSGYSLCKDHEQARCRLRDARLMLCGPDPDYVSDDPEGKEVLEELTAFYRTLPEEVQEDIIICKLPMESVKENALIVNAIQRCSYLICQTSVQEGFGLTATEAMWKTTPVIASNACGLRHQVRHEMDGLIVRHPERKEDIAKALAYLLGEPKLVEEMGFIAQKRVVDQFLVFSHVLGWLRLFKEMIDRRKNGFLSA